MADGGPDAAFVAVGAQLSKRVDIPARDAGRILDAVPFLEQVAAGQRPALGRRVAVYGGGDTAMDAARVARRLGAEDAVVVCRRTRAQMAAHEDEASEAEREGVRLNWLRTVTAFEGPELVVEQMDLDERGFPRPTGRLEHLAADRLILALGQETDTFLRSVPGVSFADDGTVDVSASMMTGVPRRGAWQAGRAGRLGPERQPAGQLRGCAHGRQRDDLPPVVSDQRSSIRSRVIRSSRASISAR